MDYEKIEKIAKRLEAEFTEDELVNGIDKSTEEEKKDEAVPEPALEASDSQAAPADEKPTVEPEEAKLVEAAEAEKPAEDAKPAEQPAEAGEFDKTVNIEAEKKDGDADADKKASLKHLIHLAKAVKASRRMDDAQKKAAMFCIAKEKASIMAADDKVNADGKADKDGITKQDLQKENAGPLVQKLKAIGQNASNITKKGLSKNTRLSEMSVNIKDQTQKLTFGWLVGLLYELVVK